MPTHGQVWRGRFNEILDPKKPIQWNDPPTFFNVPTQEMAQAPAVDEATAIARRMQETQRRYEAQRQAPAVTFAIPITETAPVKKGRYFDLPSAATKPTHKYFVIPNGDES